MCFSFMVMVALDSRYFRVVSAALRSKGRIGLTDASSGIATLLILCRITAHSRFFIPFLKHRLCITMLTSLRHVLYI
jgi:hypothetical protein